jgi:hypothetical protein
MREEGWRAADPHLHYERVEAAADRDWFHAMDGDGLTHAQFMVLKGGMAPVPANSLSCQTAAVM